MIHVVYKARLHRAYVQLENTIEAIVKLHRYIFSWKESFEIGKNEFSWNEFYIVEKIKCSLKDFDVGKTNSIPKAIFSNFIFKFPT